MCLAPIVGASSLDSSRSIYRLSTLRGGLPCNALKRNRTPPKRPWHLRLRARTFLASPWAKGSMSVCLGSSAPGGPASESGTSFTAHASAHDPQGKFLSLESARWAQGDFPFFLLRARMNLLDLYEINFTVSENPPQKRKKSAISMATKARAANATVLGGLQRQRYRTLSLGAHRLLASRFGGPVPCPMGCDARIPNRIVHSCTYKSPRTLAIHTEAQEFPSARVTLAQERAQA